MTSLKGYLNFSSFRKVSISSYMPELLVKSFFWYTISMTFNHLSESCYDMQMNTFLLFF